MQIAIFLDVDKTITKKNIQEVYAGELGVTEAYQQIEKAYQSKEIDSKTFGDRLIEIFAEKEFTKSKAEEFFDKVEFRLGVEKLFAFSERGVDIFLVSSGPNYYVEVLGERVGVPRERILSSKYFFGASGLISKCHAVEDADKVQFVVKNIDPYEITIGIGDNYIHDGFVDVCTIAMFMEPNDNHIHVPHFNAVCTLLEGLLRTPSLEKQNNAGQIITLDELKKLTIFDAFSKFSVGLWATLASIIVVVFSLGFNAQWIKDTLVFASSTRLNSSPTVSSQTLRNPP